MVTVCPRRPDYNAFIVNYLNKYYSKENDTAKLYETIVNSMILKIQEERLMEEQAQIEALTMNDLNEVCSGDPKNETEGCQLIRILHSLRDSFCKRHNGEARTLVFEYVFLQESTEGLTNEGLKTHLGKSFANILQCTLIRP